MEKNSPFTADFLLQGQASEEFHTQKVFFYSYFAIFFSQISSCSTAVVAYLPVVLATNDKKKKTTKTEVICVFDFVHLALKQQLEFSLTSCNTTRLNSCVQER